MVAISEGSFGEYMFGNGDISPAPQGVTKPPMAEAIVTLT